MSAPTNHVPTHFWKQQSPINFVKNNSLHVKFPKTFSKFDYRDAPFLGEFQGADRHGNFVLVPYSEIVSWLVFVDPIGVSSAEFRTLKEKAHQPERPVQPINRRFVIRNFQ